MAKPNPCPWAALPRDAERVVLDRFSEVLSGQKPRWLGLSRLLKERHDQDVHRDKLARWYKKYQGEDKRASAASPVPSAGAVVQAPPTVTPADTGDNDELGVLLRQVQAALEKHQSRMRSEQKARKSAEGELMKEQRLRRVAEETMVSEREKRKAVESDMASELEKLKRAVTGGAKKQKLDEEASKDTNTRVMNRFLQQLVDELVSTLEIHYYRLLDGSGRTERLSTEDQAALTEALVDVNGLEWGFHDELWADGVTFTLPSLGNQVYNVTLVDGYLRFTAVLPPGMPSPEPRRSVWQINKDTGKKRPLTPRVVGDQLEWRIEVDASNDPIGVDPNDAANKEMLEMLGELVDWSPADGIRGLNAAAEVTYTRGQFVYDAVVETEADNSSFNVIATRSDAVLSGLRIRLPPDDVIQNIVRELEDVSGSLYRPSKELAALATAFSSLMDCTDSYEYGPMSMLLCQNLKAWFRKILDMREDNHGAEEVELFFHGGSDVDKYVQSLSGFSYLFSDPSRVLHGPGVYGSSQAEIAWGYHRNGKALKGACMLGLCLVPTADHLDDVVLHYQLGNNRTSVDPLRLRSRFPNGEDMEDAVRIADTSLTLLLGTLDPVDTIRAAAFMQSR